MDYYPLLVIFDKIMTVSTLRLFSTLLDGETHARKRVFSQNAEFLIFDTKTLRYYPNTSHVNISCRKKENTLLKEKYLLDLIPHLNLMFLPWQAYRSGHNTFHNPNVGK